MFFPSFTFWRTAPAFASVASSFRNITVSGDLYIVNGNTSYPNPNGNGVISRPAVLSGLGPGQGTFPGPTINGWKGDTFSINVRNQLRDDQMLRETTIHWHGIEQIRGTGWADGVAFVTQCPIIPDDYFPYKFPVPDQAGTFWYHSHYSTQYCDGLRGPFIIRDRQDPYLSDYDIDDDSTVITLADWYRTYLEPSLWLRLTKWDLTLVNGAVKPTITVKPGKRYRFRLINISCDAPYMFSIDDHVLTVIEADGVLYKKYVVTEIPILASQRYSFILDTRSHKSGTYKINVDVPGNTGPAGSAILQYEGASSNEPITSSALATITLDEALMVPYYPAPAPGGPTVDAKDVVNHDLVLNISSEGFVINNHRFRPPSVDVLLQILSHAKRPEDLLPPGSVIPLPRNANIQLKFLNAGKTPGAPHPFHLHGHTFSVVRSILHDDYNWQNPPRRDTVSTSRFNNQRQNLDEVTIRFKTDNPGPWILHCHIDWHLEAGLALVFAEDFDGVAAWQKNIPDKWYDDCNKYWKWMGQPSSKRDVDN
ncbi:multicopper oxidase [Macrolepiota fuliginosa MF-IS2]|uniref:Multicopper oxidase n=1 Tax=Macrolepiota fuliginosa MF-IS2 TaxID=1400762 RepID=A0A9P5XPR0_9AGAR|nr:multicopper oxidase [Macrolepiota fuliginosa MF-IS2]